MIARTLRPRTKASCQSAALLGALCVLLPPGASAEGDFRALAREIYADLIAFPSAASHGGSAEIAKYAAERLVAAGFPEEDVQILGPSPESMGVLARFRGRGERAPV